MSMLVSDATIVYSWLDGNFTQAVLDNSLHNSAWLLGIVLLPFIGRFLVDYLGPAAEHSVAGRDGLCKRQRKKEIRDYRTCLDRHYVQLEVRKAKEEVKNIITVFEKEERRHSFFDYGKAWAKYGGGEWEFLLNIASINYNHVGAAKQWYGIPGVKATKFNAVMEKLMKLKKMKYVKGVLR